MDKPMPFNDPDFFDKALAAFVALLATVAGFFGKRHIDNIDEIDDRVRDIEESYVSRESLQQTVDKLDQNMQTISSNVIDIYREMPKRNNDNH